MTIDNRPLTSDHFYPTAFILFCFALALRVAIIIIWQFDGLYGQDAFAYLQQGIAIAENLPSAEPPPVTFFWPNGYPLLIAIFTVFFGDAPLAAQSVSLISGALLAPLFYTLTVLLFPRIGHVAGMLSGIIVAIAGMPITSSVVIMADMPALMWATLAATLVVKAAKTPRAEGWLLASAGAAMGLAVVSRWAYVLVVPALAGFVLLNIWRRNIDWQSPIFAVLAGLGILIPQVLLSLNRPDGLLHSWLLGWHPGNAFLRQFEHIDGFYDYLLPVGIYYLQPAGHPAYLFPLFGLAALWAIWQLWQTRNESAAILLLGWLGCVYLFFAGIPYQNLRFGLTLYPPLVILAGVGVVDLWRYISQHAYSIVEAQESAESQAMLTSQGSEHEGTKARRHKEKDKESGFSLSSTIRSRHQLWRVAGLGAIIASLIGMIVWSYIMLDAFITTQNDSKRIVAQVEATIPPNATLLTFDLTLTFQHYSPLDTRQFFYCDPIALDAITRTDAPLYLLLNVSNVERQWLGRAPYINYQWLQTETQLEEVAALPPYTLFAVDRPDTPKIGTVATHEACVSPQY